MLVKSDFMLDGFCVRCVNGNANATLLDRILKLVRLTNRI